MDLLCIMAKLKVSKGQEFYDLALQMWDEIDDRSTPLRSFRTQCVREKEELMAAAVQGLPDLVTHGEEDDEEDLRSEEASHHSEDSLSSGDSQMDATIAEYTEKLRSKDKQMERMKLALMNLTIAKYTERLNLKDKQIEKMKQALADLKALSTPDSAAIVDEPSLDRNEMLDDQATAEGLLESAVPKKKAFEDKTLDEILHELRVRDGENRALEETLRGCESSEEETSLLDEDQFRVDSMGPKSSSNFGTLSSQQ
jgi:hypothetical protein